MEETTMDNISIKDYLDFKFQELDKRLQLRAELTDKALTKAEVILNARLESMNEFREQLSKQASTFIVREAFEIKQKVLEDKISNLAKFVYIGIGGIMTIQLLSKFFW